MKMNTEDFGKYELTMSMKIDTESRVRYLMEIMWVQETVRLRCIYGKLRKNVDNRTPPLNNSKLIVTLLEKYRNSIINRINIMISQLYFTISAEYRPRTLNISAL